MKVDETITVEGITTIAASLRALDSENTAAAILHGWSSLLEWMAREGLSSLEYECYTTSRLLQDQFDYYGVTGGSILVGDIEIGPNDYLEHRANLIRTERYFAFVDLASRQFRHTDGFMLVSPPSTAMMKAALATEYRWV